MCKKGNMKTPIEVLVVSVLLLPVKSTFRIKQGDIQFTPYTGTPYNPPSRNFEDIEQPPKKRKVLVLSLLILPVKSIFLIKQGDSDSYLFL